MSSQMSVWMQSSGLAGSFSMFSASHQNAFKAILSIFRVGGSWNFLKAFLKDPVGWMDDTKTQTKYLNVSLKLR